MPTSAGDSLGESDSLDSPEVYVSMFFTGCRDQLRCRVMGSGSTEGVSTEAWRFRGDTSIGGESLTMDDDLDLSLMAGVKELITGGTSCITVRDLDPRFLGLGAPMLPQIQKESEAVLASQPEIDTAHKRIMAGSFGEVFVGTIKGRQQEVAAKVLQKDSDIRQKREAALTRQLKHNNLVFLHFVFHGPPLVLELGAGGNLADVLHGPQAQRAGVASLGPEPRARAALDVRPAVEYLHAQRTVHCDLKSRNAFLTSSISSRMADLPRIKLGHPGLVESYFLPGKTPFDDLDSMRAAQAVVTGQDPDPRDTAAPGPIMAAPTAMMHACWA